MAQDIWSSLFKFHPEFRKPEELAKRLQTKKFKLMARVIGRMRRLAVHKQKTKLNQSRDEIHSVGIGNDLSRVLPY